MDDNQLVELLKNHNNTGMRELINKYHSLIFTICHRVLRDFPEDTEECVSDTFVKIWENISTISDPQKLKAFSCTIARNTALNRLKQLQRKPVTEIDENFSDKTDTPEIFFETKENNEYLQNIIMELREPDREVFVRKYYYFESVRTIADKLGLSEKKINNILYLTRQHLRKKLSKGGVCYEK